jgi:hypothetical protein
VLSVQAAYDESAAAHKAHAELKELRAKSKCALTQRWRLTLWQACLRCM